MDRRPAQQRSEERAARAQQLRPGQLVVYRELLAKRRAGALAARDEDALARLRAALLLSGGLPPAEGEEA